MKQENFSVDVVNELFKTIAKAMRVTDEYRYSPTQRDHKKELEYEDEINY